MAFDVHFRLHSHFVDLLLFRSWVAINKEVESFESGLYSLFLTHVGAPAVHAKKEIRIKKFVTEEKCF